MAVRMSASSFSLSQGFWTKFSAPARMASTTLPTVPKAVIMMTGRFGLQLDDAGQEVDAALAGQGEIEQQQIVLVAGEQVEAGGAVGGQCRR